jgi:hypothetical protein
MDPTLVGLVAGSGWASGVNLYAVVGLLGIMGRLGYDAVPEVMTRTDVLVLAGIMFTLEFVADKIPWFDSVWDAVHTVVRPVGAVVLGAVLAGDADTVGQALAAVTSGGLATASHITKATTRLAINTSPEPASNVVVSLAEDGLVAAVVWFAVTNPIVAIVVVVVLLVAGAALTIAVVSAARRAIRARREHRRRRRETAPAP